MLPRSLLLLTLLPTLALALSLSSAHFLLVAPDGPSSASDAETLLTQLELARTEVLLALGPLASDGLLATVSVTVMPDSQSFAQRCGEGELRLASIRGEKLCLQPFEKLHSDADLLAVLRHELAHPVLSALGGRHLPRWLQEGLAMHIAQQKPLDYPALVPRCVSLEAVQKMDASFSRGGDATRRAYRFAWKAVDQLVGADSLEGVLSLLPPLKQGASLETLTLKGKTLEALLRCDP